MILVYMAPDRLGGLPDPGMDGLASVELSEQYPAQSLCGLTLDNVYNMR